VPLKNVVFFGTGSKVSFEKEPGKYITA